MTRFSAIGISLFTILTSNLIACGDGETGKGPTGDRELPGEGGGAGDATGGATSSSGGQGQTSGASSGATGTGDAGSPATTGGSSGIAGQSSTAPGAGGVSGSSAAGGTSGSSGQGGVTTAGTSATGGTATAGTSATGGTATAGTSATGGTSTAGTSATGGSSTAGTSATGGSSTAGSSATGGAATGGDATGGVGTGGVGTGGAATGGVGTGGTTAVIPCTASFIIPTTGETLTEADDISGNYCANGFFYDVIIATDAPNGTAATLTIGTGTPINGTVQNAVLKFASVQLATTGSQDLKVQIAGTAANACSASAQVNVNCVGHSTCNITAPTFTATHVALNGVPKAQSGDRISSEGSPYQAAFEVSTDIESGQAVSLEVKTGTKTDTVYAVAIAGKASFPGVTLVPDGSFTATASCQARSGFKSTSAPLTVPVDTTPPDLTVTKGTGSGAATVSALVDGDHFGPTDDADPTAGLQIKICGATTAADALDFDGGVFGTLANNLCVSTGGNTPLCAAASAGTGNGACVNFPCPGNGPFDLNITVKDKAQNPVTVTKQNLTCAAANPIVEFRDPVSGGNGADSTTFTDQSLRILAASAPGATQKKDKTGATLGAQYDVVVCTSAPAGSTAVLSQGWYGDSSMTQLANASVVADSGNLCGGTQPGVVVFQDVTLHESTVKADFTLDKATELKATITDQNFGVGSSTIDVWVDSVLPSLSLVTPANFCGSYINSGTASSQTLTFGTTIVPVTGTVTPEGGVAVAFQSSQPPSVLSQVTISGVSFPTGRSTLNASVGKPSGNSAVFPAAGTCQVTVGSTPPPIVTWIASPAGSSPVGNSILGATGNTRTGVVADSDPNTSGWQGNLRACANLTGGAAAGVTMQFSVNGANVGGLQNLNQSDGCATLGVSGANEVPEGSAVQLTARTSVTANGSGESSIFVPVDVTKPSTPINLKAVTKSHRQTSYTLSWNLPSTGSAATDYEVRVSKSVIDNSTKFSAITAEVVPFNGVPQMLGQTDSIDILNRYIETGYYFAVQATDAAGNNSDIAYTSLPTIERFVQNDIFAPPGGTNFGWSVDGTADLNGDQYSDLVVGTMTGTNAYIYFGSSSGYGATPSVTIQGTASYFGSTVAVVGDLNKDGRADIVIGSPREGNGVVYVFYGRPSWPSTVSAATANVVIFGDAAGDAKYTNSLFGQSVARLGDINNDGADDFGIGAPLYNQVGATYQGQVVVVYGKSGGLTSPIQLPAAFGTSATRIDGDATAVGRFGYWVSGSGYFYGSTGGTSLMAAAPYVTTAAGTNAGRLYTLVGKTGIPASIALTSASATFDSPVASATIGFYGIPTLGDMGPGGQPAFAVPILLSGGSYTHVRSGTMAEGPFGQGQTITTSETSTNRAFARFVGSSGISGTSVSLSTVGDARADLVISTLASGLPRIFIVDGNRLAYGTSTNVETVTDAVTVALTAPTTGSWTGYARGLTLVRDADGDNAPDIVVGNVSYAAPYPEGFVRVLR